jgi:polyhydroxybutyrate depolymerase
MFPRRLLLAGLAIAIAAAAAPAAPPARAGAVPGAQCTQPPTPGTVRVDLVSGGLARSAVVHLPAAAAGRRLPVLIALHGAGGNGAAFELSTGFSVLADDEGFVAVYPDASGEHPFWTINDHDPQAANDVLFISDLLDRVEQMACVDTTRVYATGVSNGGGMAARLACELSTRIAAIAPIAGGYKSQPPCHPDRPVSVLEVHGTSDASVPYLGAAAAGGAGAVRPFLDGWRTRDGCRSQQRVTRPAPRVLRYDWSHCAHGTAVAHLEILQGAHQLPGALPPDPGQASTVSAPWQVWAFLRSQRRAAPYGQ